MFLRPWVTTNEHQHVDWKIYPLISYGKIVVAKDISHGNIVVGDIQIIVQGIMTQIYSICSKNRPTL